ncbi:MAG TPA: oligosaccharide flippase family protein [Jatrophihabitans sp.]|nr:oligosaccharide flippase family protein [Jatrophihabitans sp.]
MSRPAQTRPQPGAGAGHSEMLTRMARGSTASLVGAAITAVCTFAVAVAVARGLSRADAGVFFTATSLFLLATSVGQLGTQTSLVYFLSRARSQRRTSAIDAYVRIAVRPVLAVAVGMAVLTFVLAGPLARLIAGDSAGQTATYLRVLAIFVPVVAFEMATLAATRGLGTMRPYSMIEQIGRPVLQLVLVVVAALAAGTTAVSWAWSLPYLAAALLALRSWRRLRQAYAPRAASDADSDADSGADSGLDSGADRNGRTGTAETPSTREPTYREFWGFSVPRGLTSVIQMLLQRLDIVLVAALAGTVDAAIYAAATRFIVVGQLGTNSLTLATQPQLAEKLAAGDRRGTNAVYQTSTTWLILVTWPVYLTLIMFGGPLLSLFGHSYTTGREAILIIALSMLVSTGLGMVDTVLAMAGHISWNVGNALLALATNIGLDLWLIPSHGIVGAAIGWAVAIVVRNVAAATQVGLALKFHPVARCTATAVSLCVASYLVVLGLFRLVLGASVTGLVTGLVCATACFAVGLWVLRRPLRIDALAGLRRRRPVAAPAPVVGRAGAAEARHAEALGVPISPAGSPELGP